MRVTTETTVKTHELVMQHGVAFDRTLELFPFRRVGQLTFAQQIGHLKKTALFRQLLDRITAIQQLALVTIDEGNRRFATRRGEKARVIRELSGLRAQSTNVDDIVSVRTAEDRKFVAHAIYGQTCNTFVTHCSFLITFCFFLVGLVTGLHSLGPFPKQRNDFSPAGLRARYATIDHRPQGMVFAMQQILEIRQLFVFKTGEVSLKKALQNKIKLQ